MNDAYVEGFVKQCEAMGVDPEALLKLAKDEVDPLAATKMLGGGAAAVGGGLSAGITAGMTPTMTRMRMNPERFLNVSRSIKTNNKAKLAVLAITDILSMGATGAGILGIPGLAMGGAVDAGRAGVRKLKSK